MSDRQAIERLNSVKYIYLRELYEPKDNSLRLVVEEAVANEFAVPQAQLPELQHIIADARPIESIEGCRKFELYWRHYVHSWLLKSWWVPTQEMGTATNRTPAQYSDVTANRTSLITSLRTLAGI